MSGSTSEEETTQDGATFSRSNINTNHGNISISKTCNKEQILQVLELVENYQSHMGTLETFCEEEMHKIIITIGQLSLIEKIALNETDGKEFETSSGILLAYGYSFTASFINTLSLYNDEKGTETKAKIFDFMQIMNKNLLLHEENDIFDGIRCILYFAASNILYVCDQSDSYDEKLFSCLQKSQIDQYNYDAQTIATVLSSYNGKGDFTKIPQNMGIEKDNAKENNEETEMQSSKLKDETNEKEITIDENLAESEARNRFKTENKSHTSGSKELEKAYSYSASGNYLKYLHTLLFIILDIVSNIASFICNVLMEIFEISILVAQVICYEITGKLIFPSKSSTMTNKFGKPTLQRIAKMLQKVDLFSKYHVKDNQSLLVSCDKHGSPATLVHKIAAATFNGIIETLLFHKYVSGDHAKILRELDEKDEVPMEAVEKFKSFYKDTKHVEQTLHQDLINSINTACQDIIQEYGKGCPCGSILHLEMKSKICTK